MKVKVGSILKGFSVHRNDGSIERHDCEIHNFMNFFLLNSSDLFGRRVEGSASYAWDAQIGMFFPSSPRKKMMAGVYSQVGTTLTRHSGENLLTNCTYVWESTGEWQNVISGTVNDVVVTKSLTVPSGSSNLWLFKTGLTAGAEVYSEPEFSTLSSTTSAFSLVYSAGVFTFTNTEIFRSRTVGASFSISEIGLGGSNNFNCNAFELPSPVALNPGDFFIIGLGDLVTTWTLDAYAPRALPVCPLTGLTTSCITQRLLPFYTTSSNLTHDTKAATRIWLLSNANKMTIPSDMGALRTSIAPATITPFETIIATGTSVTPTATNEHLRENRGVGTVVTGGSVKQIVWGDAAQLFGVIEFDTPQTLSPGQIITIGGRLRVTQDLIVP